MTAGKHDPAPSDNRRVLCGAYVREDVEHMAGRANRDHATREWSVARRDARGSPVRPDPLRSASTRPCRNLRISGPGLRLAGVIPGQNVSVIAVQPHWADAIELTYKTAAGELGQRVLGRAAEAKLTLANASKRARSTLTPRFSSSSRSASASS